MFVWIVCDVCLCAHMFVWGVCVVWCGLMCSGVVWVEWCLCERCLCGFCYMYVLSFFFVILYVFENPINFFILIVVVYESACGDLLYQKNLFYSNVFYCNCIY